MIIRLGPTRTCSEPCFGRTLSGRLNRRTWKIRRLKNIRSGPHLVERFNRKHDALLVGECDERERAAFLAQHDRLDGAYLQELPYHLFLYFSIFKRSFL